MACRDILRQRPLGNKVMEPTDIPEPTRRWLRQATILWLERGIISSGQAESIMSIYRPRADAGQQAGKRILFVLATMAVFLFATSLFLVIGYNWQAIPREAKVAIILMGIAVAHAAGFALRARWGLPLAGDVAHFLGCLVFGSGIWLVAQAWQISGRFPDGMLWWALGVLPVAMARSNLLFHFLLTGLLAVWCLVEIVMTGGPSDTAIFGWNGFPRGAYLLPLLALPGFYWAYRERSFLLLGLYVPLVAWWCSLQALAWHGDQWTVFWLGGVGSILLLCAQAHPPGDPLASPWRFWGSILTVVSLLTVSSMHFWTSIGRGHGTWGLDPVAQLNLNMVLLGAISAAWIAALMITRPWHSAHRPAFSARLALPGLIGMGIVLLGFMAMVGEKASVAAMVFGNATILGLCVLLVRVGVLEERLLPFAGGIAVFLLWTLVRYLDLFTASWGMLGAAGLFSLAGIALLLAGRFWALMRGSQREPNPTVSATDILVSRPDWMERCFRWPLPDWSLVLAVSLVLQLAIPAGMVAVEEVSMLGARAVRLRAFPVDPRDFFRGDYVILDFRIGNVIRRDIPGFASGDVFVLLEPAESGPCHVPASASRSRPDSGLFVKGRFRDDRAANADFGFEAFFVQEGEGLKWETAIRNGEVFAEIRVAPSGKARLKALVQE